MGDLKIIIPFVMVAAWLLGYWFGRQSNANKLQELTRELRVNSAALDKAVKADQKISGNSRGIKERK